jgi:hypothetical protein
MDTQDFHKKYLIVGAGVAVAYNCYAVWKCAKSLTDKDIPLYIRRSCIRNQIADEMTQSLVYGLYYPVILPYEVYSRVVAYLLAPV